MSKVCTHGRDKKVAMQQLEGFPGGLVPTIWTYGRFTRSSTRTTRTCISQRVVWSKRSMKPKSRARYVLLVSPDSTNPGYISKCWRTITHSQTAQMPLNCFDATYRSFEQQVLPELQRQGIAALGMKSLGGDGQPIQYGVVRAEEALCYAMSLPVATTICGGIDKPSLDVLHQNVGIARGFKPMSPQAMQALRERCRPSSGDGHLELFKTTKKYDGKVGREQHGYPTIAELPI